MKVLVDGKSNVAKIMIFLLDRLGNIVGKGDFQLVNSLPNDNNLEWTKLKAFAESKFNVAKIITYLLDRLGNNEGKGENTGAFH